MRLAISTLICKTVPLKDLISFAQDQKISIEFSSSLPHSAEILDLYKNSNFSRLPHNYFPAPKEPFVLNLASTNEDLREQSIQHCLTGIDLAIHANGSMYSAHAGFCIDPNPNELGRKIDLSSEYDKEKSIELFYKSVKRVLEYAEANNCQFLIENNVVAPFNYNSKENFLLCCESSEIIKLAEKFDSKYFGILLDTAHLKVSCKTLGLDLNEELSKIKPYIRALHHSDNEGELDNNQSITSDYWFLDHVFDFKDFLNVLEVKGCHLAEVESQLELLKSRMMSKNLIIDQSKSLKDALIMIDANALGFVYSVDKNHIVKGILTDGDIRRSLLGGKTLTNEISECHNTKFISLEYGASREEISKSFNTKVRNIPLLDEKGKLVDFASVLDFMNIPIAQPHLNDKATEYVMDCMATNWISSQGKYVEQFEQMFADYIGVDYALTVSNGTCAIHVALISLGIKKGDEVIVPDLTFAATINAVLHAGAAPVIVDVDRATWNISVSKIKEAITDKTKAIIPVHLYGNVCEMDEILEIAKENQLYVIEDAAEALGSEYNRQKTGSFGNAATFSFFGNKTITTGEGGMITFQEKEHYLLAKKVRDHGMSKEKRYWHDIVGYNYRMTNLQAALGVAQMEEIDNIVTKKIELGDNYSRIFSKIAAVSLQEIPDNIKSSYWLYSVLIDKASKARDEIISIFKSHKIECRPVFYELSSMPLYEEYCKIECVNSKYLSAHGLSFPSYLKLSEEELLYIEQVIGKVLDEL